MPDTANQELPIDTKSLGISEYQRHRDEMTPWQQGRGDALAKSIQKHLDEAGAPNFEVFASGIEDGSIPLQYAQPIIESLKKLNVLIAGGSVSKGTLDRWQHDRRYGEVHMENTVPASSTYTALPDGSVLVKYTSVTPGNSNECMFEVVDPKLKEITSFGGFFAKDVIVLKNGNLVYNKSEANRAWQPVVLLDIRLWDRQTSGSTAITDPTKHPAGIYTLLGAIDEKTVVVKDGELPSNNCFQINLQTHEVSTLPIDNTASYIVRGVSSQGLLQVEEFGTGGMRTYSKLIDPQTGKEEAVLVSHDNLWDVSRPACCTELPDGLYVYSKDERDNEVWLWDPLTRNPTKLFNKVPLQEEPWLDDDFYSILLPHPKYPDLFVTVSNARTINIIDGKTGEILTRIPTGIPKAEIQSSTNWRPSFTQFTITHDGMVVLGHENKVLLYKLD